MADSPSTKAPADSTTTPPPAKQDKIHAASDAFNHFSQGKRHMLVEDFKSAVASFKVATEALVQLYGEQAAECGDVYYHYGHALLELARKEAGVLGPDLDGGSGEGSTEEEEEEEEEEDETEESQEEEDEEEEEAEKKEGADDDDDDDAKKEGDDDDAKKEGPAADDDAKKGQGEKAEEEEEEEVTTLQCAWEWLDAARLILDKQEETPEISKKCAQVRLSLGQVCMEGEDYEGAINEFRKCLAIQEVRLAEDDRCLAETHYQLGLVHSLADGFDDAVTHFSAAVAVIKLKIKNLKAFVEERKTWTKEQLDKDLAETKDVFYTKEEEIRDLEQLLPDIQDKITDMQEMKAASKERLQQTAKALLLGKGEEAGASREIFRQAQDSQPGASRASAEAQPIMCQIRRKRKPEEDAEKEEKEETADARKKARLDNGKMNDGDQSRVDILPPQDMTRQPSETLPKPIAVKRKVTQNGGQSPAESSTTKTEGSSTTKTEGSSTTKTEGSSTTKTEGSSTTKTEGSSTTKTEGSSTTKTEGSSTTKTGTKGTSLPASQETK